MESTTSQKVFQEYLKELPQVESALEAGGGIGRISKTILNPLGFTQIDLQDQSTAQFAKAKEECPFI